MIIGIPSINPNRSISSYSLQIILEDKNEEIYEKSIDNGVLDEVEHCFVDPNLHCEPEELAKAKSLRELEKILLDGGEHMPDKTVKNVIQQAEENGKTLEDIKTLTLKRMWITSGCYSHNMLIADKLIEKAKAVLNADKTEKEKAKKDLEEYLDHAHPFQLEFPTGFCNNKKRYYNSLDKRFFETASPENPQKFYSIKSCYRWREAYSNVETLAKDLAEEKIGNGEGIEKVVIDFQTKEIQETIEYIIGTYETFSYKRKPSYFSRKIQKFIDDPLECIAGYEIVTGDEIKKYAELPEDLLKYYLLMIKNDNIELVLAIIPHDLSKSKKIKDIAKSFREKNIRYQKLNADEENPESGLLSKIYRFLEIKDPYHLKAMDEIGFDNLKTVKLDEYDGSGKCWATVVKFSDGRSYCYDSFTQLKKGDTVFVTGKRTGRAGRVMEIWLDDYTGGFEKVVYILKK